MTRRGFSVALAGAGVFGLLRGFASGERSSVVILNGIAGARLPETLAIATSFPEKIRRGLWELRTYRTGESQGSVLAAAFTEIFPRAGIRPLLRSTDGPDVAYLIPFEDLAARDHAWAMLNADPAWMSARPRFQSYHFGLYRAA
jgi:hypothetical protein